MKLNRIIIKSKARYITNIVIGVLYFPIYLSFWLIRLVSRFILAISHFGTLNFEHGLAILKSIFQKDYERNF